MFGAADAIEHVDHAFAGADGVAAPAQADPYFRRMPQRTPVPGMAPVRVAMITSPEPMYSAHQIMEGPTIARPRGGDLISPG